MRDVTVEEIRESFSVPTITVNRFLISTNPAQVRVAFGETLSPDDPVNWRVALSLTPYEAWELKQVLTKLMEPFEPQFATAGTEADGQDAE